MEAEPKGTSVCLDFGNGIALIVTARVVSVNVTGAIERVPLLLQYRCKGQTWGYGFRSLRISPERLSNTARAERRIRDKVPGRKV